MSEMNWPKIGLGTGTLASLGRRASLKDVRNLLVTLEEIGGNLIDTADTYGSGDCECLLGKALSDRRESFLLITKAGYRYSNLPSPFRPLNQFIKKGLQSVGLKACFEPMYLSKCLDNSLRRLRTERLDAFLLHDPALEDLENAELLKACSHFVASGKTQRVGVSSSNPDVLKAAIASGIFNVIQTPANLESLALIPLWQACEREKIQLMGNHIFAPSCLALNGASHESLMRTSSALMPKNATLLCGSRNVKHLIQAHDWATHPFSIEQAKELALALNPLTLPHLQTLD